MKALLQVMFLMLVSGVAFGQEAKTGAKFPASTPKAPVGITPTSAISPLKEYKALQQTRTDARWMNYGLDFADLLGKEPTYSLMPIFPDTNIIAGISGGKVYVPIYHAAATVNDPTSFLNWPWTDSTYQLDQMWLKCAYIRSTEPEITDTLVLSIFEPNFISWGILNGGKKLKWRVVGFDAATNTIDPTLADTTIKVTKIKYLLTESDSSTLHANKTAAVKDIYFDVNNFPELKSTVSLGAAIQFIPGYTYSYNDGDSVFGKNAFFLYSSEENGLETEPEINDTFNFNQSYVLTTESRYGDTASVWRRQFFPCLGYEAKFTAENHMIYFHFAESPVGIKEVSVYENISLYPNPAKESALFTYELSENARNVSLVVYDLTGKELLRNEEGNQPTGYHNLHIDTQKLLSGMYLYSFTVDGETANGKFIVD